MYLFFLIFGIIFILAAGIFINYIYELKEAAANVILSHIHNSIIE